MTKIRNERGEASGGVGLLGLVFIVFLFLKLAEIGAVADWSWWAVTAPLWVPAGLVAIIAVAALVVWAVGLAFESKQARARRKARAALFDLRDDRLERPYPFGRSRGRR